MRLLFVCIAPLFIASCAFTHVSHYRPFGPGDTLTTGACGGTQNTMGYKIDNGLGLVVSAWPFDKEKLSSVYLDYHVGEGHTFQLSAPSISIVTIPDNLRHSFPIGSFKYEEIVGNSKPAKRKTLEFQPTEPLAGAMLPSEQRAYLSGSFYSYRGYRAVVNIGGLSAKRFRLVFPVATLDGNAVQTPDIEFEYREEYVTTCLMSETPNNVLQRTLLASRL